MTLSKPVPDAAVWMSGTYSTQKLQIKRAIVREKLSTPTETTIEFLSRQTEVNLEDIVGKIMTVHMDADVGTDGRMFTGTCISVESLGIRDSYDHYVAEVRPWFWMLTLTRNTRVFQNMTVIDIIKDVLGVHEMPDFEMKTSDTYKSREYCVQYRESDFDFLSRLMEEEGIYYYFEHKDAFEKNEKLIFCDSIRGHRTVRGKSTIPFKPRDMGASKKDENITEWAQEEAVVRGLVALGDYDFEKPDIAQIAKTPIKSGKHKFTKIEHYDLPGHYRSDQNLGDGFSRVRIQADAARHDRYRGAGNSRYMGTGLMFTLKDHLNNDYNIEYLVTDGVHYLQDAVGLTGEDEQKQEGQKKDTFEYRALEPRNIDFPKEIKDNYCYVIGTIPANKQFRAPLITPWPEVPGLQTGRVVGPAGAEIHTDRFGRIKVLFRWDRSWKKPAEADDSASCWIRVVTPWSGTNWGMDAIPRVGQEVVIQFEDGDPDRPICTGMLYNEKTMPPYVDERQPTKTGIMTRSSPGGGENDFNAVVFEDKSGDEFMHVQAQKDYQLVVKNSANIFVGQNGPTVDEGEQDAGEGSLRQVVEMDVNEEVTKGSKEDIIKAGDLKIQTVKGKILIEAAKEIELKVGSSSVTLTPTGVKINSSAVAEMKSAKIGIQGSGMVEVGAPMVKIN